MGIHFNIVRFVFVGPHEKFNEIVNVFPHLVNNLYFLLSQRKRGHEISIGSSISLSSDKRVSKESNEESHSSKGFPYALSESNFLDRGITLGPMRSRVGGGRWE